MDCCKRRSVPGEVCLDAKAGDMCITHCDLMHGSTYNTSDEYRYFISEYAANLQLARSECHTVVVHTLLWLQCYRVVLH
jgi:hypothetical protein